MMNYWEPKEIPWLSSGEVNKKRLNETDNMISKEGLENSSAHWVKENSIMIALAGQGKTRGTVAVNNIPLTTNQSIAAIEPDETLNFEFIFQNLSKRYDELRMMSSGDGTRGGLNKKIIYDVRIAAPIIEEQEKIGAFFKQLDNTIVQNERKIDLLRQLKQAYLQRIFSQELRFTGFNDNWEERKIMDLFEERVERSSHGQMISVTIGSGVVLASSLDRKDNSSSDKSNYKVVRKNDIAYNSMRMWQGASGVSPYNGILSPAYTIITPKISVNSGFFAIQFKMTKSLKTFQKYSQGLTSDTWNLKYPALGIIPMLAPNITEQKRIYHFFGNLDDLIGKYERKISLLKRKKRAYLQKMFI